MRFVKTAWEQVKLGPNASSWREARESVFSRGTCFCFWLVGANVAVFFCQSHGVSNNSKLLGVIRSLPSPVTDLVCPRPLPPKKKFISIFFKTNGCVADKPRTGICGSYTSLVFLWLPIDKFECHVARVGYGKRLFFKGIRTPDLRGTGRLL